MSNAASRRIGALLALLLLAGAAQAADPSSGQGTRDSAVGEAAATSGDDAGNGDPDVRNMSGTSIIGNRELPKSLYIVPWKNSQVGVRTDLSRDLLDEGLNPVDPNEFERQVNYYEYHQQQQ